MRMKKYLSVEVDDNGKFHLSSDFPQDYMDCFLQHPEQGEKAFTKLIQSFVPAFWDGPNPLYMKLIRTLFMTGVVACAEPYCEAEDMWSTLMFSFIPQFEKRAAAIKRKYGFDDSGITRPFSLGTFPQCGIMPLSARDFSSVMNLSFRVEDDKGGKKN